MFLNFVNAYGLESSQNLFYSVNMDTFAYLMLQPQHELVRNINQIIVTIKFLQLYTVLSNGIHSYIYLLH